MLKTRLLQWKNTFTFQTIVMVTIEDIHADRIGNRGSFQNTISRQQILIKVRNNF